MANAEQREIVGTTLAVKVADKLRDSILGRKIQPGTRITTREIAEKYGVSNVPVREAFSQLCGENLLENLPYKGVVVKAVTSDMIKETIDLLYALEVLLVELCMEKGYSRSVIERLKTINEEMKTFANTESSTSNKRLDMNIRFHLALYSPCKTHMAYELYEKYLRYISMIRRYYPVGMERTKETAIEHEAIIAAIEQNDLEALIAATRLHSKNSKMVEAKFIDEN